MKLRVIYIALAMVFLVTLAGCSVNSTHTQPSTASSSPASTKDITLSVANGSAVLSTGKSITLLADTESALTWTSSDINVADVDENGTVTGGHKAGTAVITAKSAVKSAMIEVANSVTMRSVTAADIVADMKIGTNLPRVIDSVDWSWNIGYDSNRNGDRKAAFYASKGIPIDDTDIASYKEVGINAIRLPVTWSLFTNDTTFEIDKEWLDAVEKNVAKILNSGMYCIIDAHNDYMGRSWVGDHWASDWMEEKYKDYVDARYTAIMSQIAERFKDYDDYLIIENMNEPGQLKDLDMSDKVKRLNGMNQTFIDIVRSSGGNNATRCLLVGGVDNNTPLRMKYTKYPDDKHLIISIHSYYGEDMDTGVPQPSWSVARSDAEKIIDDIFNRVDNFKKNTRLPVIVAEWGCKTKYATLKERAAYADYFVKRAAQSGIPCFWWDWDDTEYPDFILYDRRSNKWVYKEIMDAITNAANLKK